MAKDMPAAERDWEAEKVKADPKRLKAAMAKKRELAKALSKMSK